MSELPTRTLQIFIHLGLWKSGSTAIQHFLHSNRALLGKHGYIYPNGEVVPMAHHELPTTIKGDLKRKYPGSEWSQRGYTVENLFEKYSPIKDFRKLILSSDDFALLSNSQFNELHTALVKHFNAKIQITLIYFCYRVEDRLSSFISEYIRNGVYLSDDMKSELHRGLEIDIHELKNRLKLLNSEKFSIIELEYRKSPDEYLITEFLKALEIDFHELKKELPLIANSQIMNRSLNAKELELLNEFNYWNTDSSKLDKNIEISFSDSLKRNYIRFVLYKTRIEEADQARAEADQARAEADQARAEADQARAEADQARAEADQARAEADQIISSRIWRYTRIYRNMRGWTENLE